MNQKQVVKVIVGSKNPVKVNACKLTLERLFEDVDVECIGMDAPSGVAEQPMTEQETLQGARNRIAFCQQHHAADYYVAMEGGVDRFAYGAATFAFMVVANNNREQVGRTANLPLPDSVYEALTKGEELGPLMDTLFGTSNVKQKGGAIGLLTNGVETRTSNYIQALTLAMAPFLHPDRFS